MMEVLDQIKQMMKVPDTPIDAGDALQWQPRLQRLLFVLQVDLPEPDFFLGPDKFGIAR